MQQYTSAATSINAVKIPALFGMVSWAGGLNVDLGGGRYDNVAGYLARYGTVNMVWDPFNRAEAHNERVQKIVTGRGGADTVTISNVLNVIDSREARFDLIKRASLWCRIGGRVYITVYEGDRSGTGRQTGLDQWQENRRTADYIPEIREYFDHVERHGKLIVAWN